MIETRIARRYLWAARKRAHTAFLSAISILGLAVGVAALLFSIALLSGLQGQIKGRLMEASPQLLVEPSGKNTIDGAEAMIAIARQRGMHDVRPYVAGIAYAANEAGGGRPLRIRSYPQGREPERERGPRTAIPPGDESQIFLTRGAAAGLGLDLGQEVTVIAPRSRLTPFGPVPVWKKYRITRLVTAGDESTSQVDAWLEQSEASSFFGTEGKPTAIEMYGPPELAKPLQQVLAGDARFSRAQFKTWEEINRPLVLALRLEKIVMFATISLVILVAALNLVSSLSMLILEKRPSVGVLRTIGATNRGILAIFLQVGLFIGLIGTLLGNVLGIGLAWLLDRYQLISLPPDIYSVSYLPFRLDVQDVVVVNAITICLSVIATWYPAHIASRLDPITAITE